ncbi:MAG: TRAP transporter substrate-binding protein [Oscillospiraceae bacterium]|nr:TRAP transporter substrate-binding protein [Oscillospiraceae bacterium]
MKKVLSILLSAALALCLAGCGADGPEVVPEYVLTYAENQPEDHPATLGARKFADLVAERTGGKVVIQVKADAEFGTQQEVLDQMAFGGIDFARVSLSSISDELPVLNVLQLPFLYEDADHMWRVLDGQIGADFLQVFQEQGLVGLSWYDGGARSFYSTVPIRSVEDFAGLRIRVQDSQMMADMVTLLGGIPETAAYNDVYAAFETGQIDGAENNWPSYLQQAHYDLAPYYTVDAYTRVPEVQLASSRTWDALPEEYRDIIAQCAVESARYQRDIWTEQETLSRTEAIAGGCQEIRLSAAACQEFRRTVQPLYEQYCAEYMDLIRQIQES